MPRGRPRKIVEVEEENEVEVEKDNMEHTPIMSIKFHIEELEEILGIMMRYNFRSVSDIEQKISSLKAELAKMEGNATGF